MSDIRIYVADLAAYDKGILHGVWIDATADVSDMHKQVDAMLVSSPTGDAWESAIHGFEGFDGYSVGEYAGLQAAHDLAMSIARSRKMSTTQAQQK